MSSYTCIAMAWSAGAAFVAIADSRASFYFLLAASAYSKNLPFSLFIIGKDERKLKIRTCE